VVRRGGRCTLWDRRQGVQDARGELGGDLRSASAVHAASHPVGGRRCGLGGGRVRAHDLSVQIFGEGCCRTEGTCCLFASRGSDACGRRDCAVGGRLCGLKSPVFQETQTMAGIVRDPALWTAWERMGATEWSKQETKEEGGSSKEAGARGAGGGGEGGGGQEERKDEKEDAQEAVSPPHPQHTPGLVKDGMQEGKEEEEEGGMEAALFQSFERAGWKKVSKEASRPPSGRVGKRPRDSQETGARPTP